jgi:hypothetical protein
MTPGFFSFFYVSQTTVGSLASTSAAGVAAFPGELLCCLPFCSPMMAFDRGTPFTAPASAPQMNNCARGKVWTDDPKVAAHS